MKLDNENQRGLLLQLINGSQFPGSARKAIYELGEAIETAEIEAAQTDLQTTATVKS